MKVSFLLLNAYTVGGTVRTVVNQASALAAAGHEVEVVSVRRQRERPAFDLHPKVSLRPLLDMTRATPPWRRRMESVLQRPASRLVPPAEVRSDRFNRLTDRRIVRYLQSLDDGVLITTRPALNLLAARFTRPSVITVGQEHSHYARHKPGLAEEIGRWYPALDALTVLTAADKDDYCAALGGSGVRIETVPNPLAGSRPARSSLDRPLVVAAGRLVRAKGFHHLIQAFAQVVDAHPDWRLRIFGGGPEEEALRRLIHDRHLYNHVYLMGSTDQLEEELAKASVFALSSQHEGFGMVLAEAMSHGVPAVSFDCPQGPREIISHGEDGLLVPLGDVRGLAGALTRLIEDGELRRTMGDRAAASARRYSAESVQARWVDLLTDLSRSKESRTSGPLSRGVTSP